MADILESADLDFIEPAFEFVMDGMAILDPNGECVYANGSQASIYGFDGAVGGGSIVRLKLRVA